MKPIYILFRSAFCLAVLVIGFTAIESQAQAQTAQQELSASPDNATGPIIEDIVINGLQRIEPLNILYQLDFAIGDRYNEKIGNQTIKKLIASQLFDNVTIAMRDNVLTLDITEAPVISKINIEGNLTIKDEDLMREINISSRQPFNRSEVASAARRLLAVYQATGFFHAEVNPTLIRQDQNRVDLIFDITEGKRGTIRSIRFLGNEAYSAFTLRGVLTTREGRWYVLQAAKTYDPNRLNFDRGQLRNFYLKRGFLQFSIRNTLVELHPNREDFLLTFVLNEGKRFKIQSASVVTSINEFDLTEIDKLAKNSLEPGSYYDVEDIESFIEDIKDIAEDKGFHPVEVLIDSSLDDDKAVVDLAFSIVPGRRQIVKEIRISGNLRTRDNVIRRVLSVSEGKTLRSDDVRKSRSSLLALGYFSAVDIQWQSALSPDGTETDQVIIDVVIEEKATGSVKFGAGYNSALGLQGIIGFSENNLVGKGYQIKADISIAQRQQNYSLSFTNPYVNDTPLSLGTDLFSVDRSNVESGYRRKNQGARFHIGYPLGSLFSQSFRFEASKKTVSYSGTLASPYLKPSLGSFSLYGVGHTSRISYLDNPQRPHSGFRSSFDFDIFGLSDRVGYFSTRLDMNGYIPVTQNSTIKLTSRLGYVHSLLKNQPVNITDRLFAGGSNLPRGFASSGIGPRDGTSNISLGGRFSWVASLEYEFLFGVPVDLGIYALAFFDAGTVLFNDDRVLSGHPIQTDSLIRTSAGFGFRWYSPFAPFTLTFGWPITMAKHDIKEVFGFTFGVGL